MEPRKFKFLRRRHCALCSGENLQQLLMEVTTEMSELKQWFSINNLSLNLNKTKFMLFGNHSIDTEVQMTIDNVNVERVYETKNVPKQIYLHCDCVRPHCSDTSTAPPYWRGEVNKCKQTRELCFSGQRALQRLYFSTLMICV